MTVDHFASELQLILAGAYIRDPSIRHDPLWQAVDAFLRLVQTALEEASDDADNEALDDADNEAFQKWQAGKLEGGASQ